MRSDEHGHEAFQQVAALLSSLFRSTDLVPSDVLAGCILLRVKQKKETREMRRIQMLSDDEPKYTAGNPCFLKKKLDPKIFFMLQICIGYFR